MVLARRLAAFVSFMALPAGASTAAEMASYEAVYRLSLEDLRIEGWAEKSGGTMEFRFAQDCFHWAIDRHLEFGIRFTDGRRTQIVVSERLRESLDGQQFWFWSRTTLNGGTARIIAGHAVRPEEGQMVDVEPPKDEAAENGKDGEGKPGSSAVKTAAAAPSSAGQANAEPKVERRLLGVVVDYDWPDEKEVEVDRDIIFSFTALSRQLDKLQSDSLIKEQRVFDGSSDSGAFRVVYEPGAKPAITAMPVPEGEAALLEARSWRLRTRYFPLEGQVDKPARTTTALLHANGVISQMVLDYGPFSVKGDISSIKQLKVPACRE